MIDTIIHVNLAKGFRGGERQTVLLIENINKLDSNIKQILVCRKNSDIPKNISNVNNLSIVNIRSALGGHYKINYRTSGKTITIAHEAKAAHWASIQNALNKIPYIIVRRVPNFVKNSWFNRFCYNNSSYIVSVSNAIRENVIKSFGNSLNLSGRLRVIYSVTQHKDVDKNSVTNIKKEYEGKIIFGHVGAYVDRHKGQLVLIEAAREFVKTNPNCVFLCLGNGEDEELLKNASKDVPQIKWLGFKKNVAEYIASMDYFLFPSRIEGLGSTVLDAMDQNIPVIGSNIDGIPEMIKDHETGLLFECGNSRDLLRCMNELVGNKDLISKLTTNAQKQMNKFSGEHMAQSYLNLIDDILK